MLYARIGGLRVAMSNNSDITIYDFENICRTCLSPDDLKPLYEKWLPSASLVDMLMACTVVKFAEDDGLPVKICINCINEITQAFLFAQRCEATDTVLRNCVKKINTEFACNSSQAQNIQPKQEIKIEVEPYSSDGTIRDVLGDYKIKEEEFTSEIILPTEEKILDDFQDVKEEVTQKEDLNIEYEETFDDPMVENEDDDPDAMYSKTSDIPNSRPRRRCTISQMEKNKSKDDDSETCDNYADESYEDKDESYSEKTTHMCKVLPDSHLKVYSGPYDCHVCRESFNSSSNLEVHKLIHTSEKPHVCSVCSKAFEIKGSLKIHMRIHSGEKNHKCEVCSKAFNRPYTLHRHMRLHTGEKPYTCEVCSRAFADLANFKSHMRIHNGERNYKCEVCSKAFTQVGHLKLHMRIHNGEKNYKCEVCSKAFTQVGHLKGHMSLHTGEKPYACEVCSKAFKSTSNMRRHMRLHTEKKFYTCEVCSKAFKHNSNLKTHMRKHTG